MEITCYVARHRGLPPQRSGLPADLKLTTDEPGSVFYPSWAVVATVTIRTPLTGEVKRHVPILVDALTDRMAILPGAPAVEPRDVPPEAVIEPKVELTDERLRDLRASLIPFLIRRLRLAASPNLDLRIAGLAHKELLVYEATVRDTPCRLYVDTLTAEWTLRPVTEGGAVDADAPPALP